MSYLRDVLKNIVNNSGCLVEQVNVYGSQVDQNKVDFWSDTDLLVKLQPNQSVHNLHNETLLFDLGRVVGREEHRSEETLTQRYVLYVNHTIQRLDLKFCTHTYWEQHKLDSKPGQKILYKESATGTSDDPVAKNATSSLSTVHKDFDKLWFLLFETIKKWMRNDHLIGLHLLLECVQEYLVLRMKERDVEYNTTTHRQGYSEQLPASIQLKRINDDDKSSILDYIKALAKEIEQKMQNMDASYERRMYLFNKYIEDCKTHIHS